MKKALLFIVIIGLFAALGCSDSKSKKKPVTDGDTPISDIDNPSDADEAKPDIDEVKPDTEILPDGDTKPDTDEIIPDVDEIISDTDSGPSVCNPNPCSTTELTAAHRTQCMPEPKEAAGYKCVCSVLDGFHDDNGICCGTDATNVNGKCACKETYIDPDNSGKCVPVCDKDGLTQAHLSGWCSAGKVCIQGTCETNSCETKVCPEHSTCSIKDNNAVCLCDVDGGFHMDNNLCCQEHASNKNNSCVCDSGYEPDGTKCVATANNPCGEWPADNPCNESHKNLCVVDESLEGYHCDCNNGYTNVDGTCKVVSVDVCPNGTTCTAGYCITTDSALLEKEQCITNNDCHEFNPNSTSICNAAAAGGICNNCQGAEDCPGNTQCNDYGTCQYMCDTDMDCPHGVCAETMGICRLPHCKTNEDCFGGTVCIVDSQFSDGMCMRIPCNEKYCSPTNPDGECPNMDESCLGGKCVNSCTPVNPCTEPNKTVCQDLADGPVCSCAAGTALDVNGKCKPIPTANCPGDLECSNGYCTEFLNEFFECSTSSDCEGLNCSPKLPSGICSGCQFGSDCPTNGEECVGGGVNGPNGVCMKPCVLDSECHDGMKCKATPAGYFYCGSKTCLSPADCGDGYTCTESGVCNRIPCI